ncbi:MAG TPA: hypothetical protein V6D50_06855 [Chroococcales cyanobacterium]|jgi:hypothetical protein
MNSELRDDDFERQESLKFRPGQRVQLKANPDVVDTIAEYDPMMVPPIWLANDPKPRYPHELNLITSPILGHGWLKFSRSRQSASPASSKFKPFSLSGGSQSNRSFS